MLIGTVNDNVIRKGRQHAVVDVYGMLQRQVTYTLALVFRETMEDDVGEDHNNWSVCQASRQ